MPVSLFAVFKAHGNLCFRMLCEFVQLVFFIEHFSVNSKMHLLNCMLIRNMGQTEAKYKLPRFRTGSL